MEAEGKGNGHLSLTPRLLVWTFNLQTSKKPFLAYKGNDSVKLSITEMREVRQEGGEVDSLKA